ncbi:AfsR/SARP family transcriptional regulator [Mangrovihabitans endophyticus]|uniref:SARP family transcriptional regulator n=1 Tax=Mangrovihabitans endophyticus TaxID=1751298 RepID=A0A8J3FL14_9ACTN|nr:BTAD domain-containing putative transcriptional regulator [Mangrovihabitans endophyticus]GGK75615.1 SARP family transcriptional regulator [Mangrovihabitans endophyticus]
MIEFVLLGPVEIRAGRQPIDLLQPRQSHVLAALLVDVNRPVPWATLVDRVWGAHPPDGARTAMRAHVSRIRHALRFAGQATEHHETLTHRGGGYELRADPEQVDLHRLRRLAERARRLTTDAAARARLLREAVGLWRGEPLAGLTGEWTSRVRSAWQHERLGVFADWAWAELELGNAASVLSVLTELTEDYPLVESIAAAHVRALHAVGRTAEAIDRYMRIRARLADELGVSPGDDLLRAHRIVVRETASTGSVAAARPGGVDGVPAQLPLAVRGFVGRRAQLTRMDTMLDGRAGTTAVMIVRGTAGIGKTALAVHWAHQVADRFPDGQLYVNLRGFDPVVPRVEPDDAIRRLLLALNVPAHRIPADPDASAALYRAELARRRMVILLDNARDESQVRPLLPGPSGCVVVVTSREALTGLVAAEGADTLGLDVLSTDDGAQMLGGRLGPERLIGEWRAASEIIESCAGLPLALAVAAARAAARPQSPLSDLADELGRARNLLDVLAGNDPHTDLRAVLANSYLALSAPGRRMFRLLGLHPGADITAPAAASLAALPLPQASALLAELAAASLLREHPAGRFACHDLLRAYASELAVTMDPDHHEALLRVLDHYLHTAHAAGRRLSPRRDPMPLDPPRPGTTPGFFTDVSEADDWFAAERATLLAAVERASAAGLDRLAWQLAGTLQTYLGSHRQWADLAAVTGAGLAAAVRLGDPAMQARARRQLGRTWTRLGRFDDAERELTHGLDQYGTLGDLAGQAHAHHHLSHLFQRRDRLDHALDHAQQALDLYRKAGDRGGEARALTAIGWFTARIGDHRPALAAGREALELFRELDDRPGEAGAWGAIGFAHRGLGDDAAAVGDYRRALALFRQLGNRYHEADTLTRLGDAQRTAGDPAGARETWRQALVILGDLRHPDRHQVRARLDDTAP